jgi:hypothetical protein
LRRQSFRFVVNDGPNHLPEWHSFIQGAFYAEEAEIVLRNVLAGEKEFIVVPVEYKVVKIEVEESGN